MERSFRAKLVALAKKCAKWALQVALIGAIAGGCCELLLRVAAPQPPVWLDIYRRHPRLPFFALQPNARYAVDTRETKWTALTDGEGHRMLPGAPPDDPARPAVLWLGDSFVFGHGVDYDKTFVVLLSSAGKFRSINTGVPGYGPAQYRQILEDALAQGARPRFVVALSFLGNDFDDCVINKDVPIVDGVVDPVGGWRSYLQRHSHFYRLAMKAYAPFRRRSQYMSGVEAKLTLPDGEKDARVIEALRVYRDELERIKKICAERSIGLFVALIPSRASVAAATGQPFAGDPAADYARVPRKAVAIVTELGIRHLDLSAALAAERLERTYFNSDGHFTPFGHTLVAAALRDAFPELKFEHGS